MEVGWHKSGFGFQISHQPDQITSDNFLPCSEPQISPVNGLAWTRGSLQSRLGLWLYVLVQ